MINYRPVSNLSFVSKLVERVVSMQLNNYLIANNLQEPHQSAYRRGHSTESALVHVYDNILQAIGSHKAVLFVMLDLSSAFDTVDHRLLQDILLNLGIVGTASRWLESYLCNRRQKVVVEKSTSGAKKLECGVPQGSVLGPILFTLYTASLGGLLRSHGVHYHFYADDAQIWMPFEPDDADNARTKMEKCLEDTKKWMAFHKLKLNATKTEYMVISSRQLRGTFQPALPLSMDGTTLTSVVKPVKNLGTMIQSNASMDAQINAVCKSCYALLRNIAKIKRFLDYKTLETMIHVFISSKLDYCNSLLLGSPQCQLQKLQKIQNAAARILTDTPFSQHMTPVLFRLHWLPVQQRVKFKLLLVIHKALVGDGPAYLRDLLQRRDPQGRRSENLLVVPFTRSSTAYNRAFSIAGPRMWNSLPATMRDCSTLVFKKRLKTLLFSEFYNYM